MKLGHNIRVNFKYYMVNPSVAFNMSGKTFYKKKEPKAIIKDIHEETAFVTWVILYFFSQKAWKHFPI